MMPLFWSVLLLCLSTNAEDTAVYRWERENVTLKCSSEGCPRSVEDSIGMYLNGGDCKGVGEVLYHHRGNGKITPRGRFSGRIATTGSLMNHTITISRLTMEDAGCYRCAYVNKHNVQVECNSYTLVVREDTAVYRWERENVTLKCSSEGCPRSVEDSIGMYLNRRDCKGVGEVLYHHRGNGKITPRGRFSGRIATTGSLMNHTITISRLTMEDAGCYRCAYVNKHNVQVECNSYTLVVREDTAVYRWERENVTLKCSSEGCPISVEDSIGMYLNKRDGKGVENVLYHHRGNGKISPRDRFSGRIATTGPLMNHTITISRLTMEDAGCYHCAYVNKNDAEVECNSYTLVVRGLSFQTGKPSVPPNQSPSLVLVIIATCAISSLVTVIFILLIQRTKQWTDSRRTVTQRVSNNNVYEVMTRNAPRPAADPEQSSPSPSDVA